MNDAELLRLLQEKLPADFTEAELAALRARWKDSPEIRAALSTTLELETELATGLADVSLSVDDLMARAASRRQSAPAGTPRWWFVIGLTAVVLLAVGVGVWGLRIPRKGADDAEIVAIQTPTAPADAPAVAVKDDPTTAASKETEKSAEAVLAATLPNETTPTAVATPPVIPPDAPWAPWFNGELAPLPLSSPRLRADLRTMGHDEIPLAEFQRWWAEVPGIAAGWNEAIIGGRRTVQMDGRMQLKAPWVDDAVLRFTPFDLTDMTLLFGDNERGVALRFYKQREPHIWAAYEFQRPPGETAIKWGGLLTTDGGAWYRSGAVTFEVRRQDGQLILSAGKIPLLSVPLPEAPPVVQLIGRGRIRGFSWLRARPWPINEPTTHPVILDNAAQETPSWQTVKPGGAMVHVETDGAVLLTGSSKNEDAQAFTTLSGTTLVESIFRFSAADAGTGVYLGNEQGKPLCLLGISQDRRTKQLTFAPLRPQDRRIESEYDPNAFPPPYWSPNVWLKIVAGLGTCQVWSSGDGIHWGHIAENPLNDPPGSIQSIGVFCFPGETPRSIRVASYQVRELTGITQFADEESIRKQVPSGEKLPTSYGEWETQTIAQLPDDVAPSAWMTHAGIAALQAGPSRSLAREIVERLAVSERFRSASFDEQTEFLNAAASLLDIWNENDIAPFRRAYLNRPTSRPAELEANWTAWLQSPVWTHAPIVASHWDNLATALQTNAFANDHEALKTVAPDAQFWLSMAHPDHRVRAEGEVIERLARWSRSVAGTGDRQDDADVLPLGWRHPLQLTINKEAYNVQSELRSALTGGTFQDAGRIAMNFGANDGAGLLPDPDDDQLFVSIPVAMASAVKAYPAFGEILRDDFGSKGTVRVRQAARQGDLGTLRSATLQFFGTPAAAEAERILGDRLMAIGDCFGALRRYRDALRSADEDQRPVIESRTVLAESLAHSHIASVPNDLSEMKLDGVPLAPLVREFHPETAAVSPSTTSTPGLAVRYRLDVKGKFDGQVGQNAGRGEFRHVDAFGRQFAVIGDDQRFYISNRFQTTAYKRDDGQQLWAASVGSDQGEAHAHRFTPMKPLLAGDKLLVRRIIKGAIELACLNPNDGQVLWKTRGGEKADILSEPIALPGRIGVVVSHRVEDDSLDIRWAHLSTDKGETLSEFPLLRLRDAWSGEPPCTLAVRDYDAVATIGGSVIHFDTTGSAHWVRRETWLPMKVDPQAEDYFVPPPHFARDRDEQSLVIVTVPGSRRVLGIDLTSGHLRWQTVRPQLQGILVANDHTIVISEEQGLAGLSATTGETVWSQSLKKRMTAHQLVGSKLVVATAREGSGNKVWPQLMWFDVDTGAPLGEAQIEGEEHPDWRCGPLFATGTQWWMLFGKEGNKPQRELAMLSPTSEASPDLSVDSRWDDWISAPPTERRIVQSVLPGWQPVAKPRNVFHAPAEPVRDRRPVLVAKSTKSDDSIRLVRTVLIPQTGSPALRLRVGHQAGQSWQLEVRVGSRIVISELVADDTAPGGWREMDVALQPFAGQTVTLQLVSKNVDAKSVDTLWHEAQLTGFDNP